MNTAGFLCSTLRKLKIYVWEIFWVILVRAKYHNRTFTNGERSKQQIYYHPYNSRRYPVLKLALQYLLSCPINSGCVE